MPGFAITSREQANGPLPGHKAEFHRAHRWRIDDLGIPLNVSATDFGDAFASRLRLATMTASGRSAAAIAGQGPLKIYAKSCNLPSISFEEEKVPAGSMTYKFPRRIEWENVTIEFYDVWGLFALFNEWRSRIWTPEEGIRPADDFVGRPIIHLVDGKDNVKQTFILNNAYPINIAHGEMSYTSSEVKTLSITYSYSHADIIILDNNAR